MNELISEWVEKAKSDFYSADVLLLHARKFPIPDSACFNCPQCVGKYPKARLQERIVCFERTHNLTMLLDLCLLPDQEFENLRSGFEKTIGCSCKFNALNKVLRIFRAQSRTMRSTL